jgi:hypothetical protein
MKQFGTIVSVVLGLLALAVIVAPPSHSASPDPSKDVNVVNTPLPIQGTVSVNNFPATQAISGNVNATITGTPTVGITNTISNPLLVEPVSVAGNSFWTGPSTSVFFGGGSAVSASVLSVNPGQLAVITAAATRCSLDNGTNIQYVEIAGNAFAELQYQTSSLGASEEMTSTLPGPIYVDGGSGGASVSMTVSTNKTQSIPSDCNFSVSGYYLNESH